MHVRRDDHFLNDRQRVLPRAEKLRNDAGDLAAMIQGRLGDGAHQPDRAAAIDQADIVLSKYFSESDGCFDKAGVAAWAGAAIDTDGFDVVHELMWHCNVK